MTKAEKEAFKKRMAAGRKKAAKARGTGNPKRKPAKKRKAKNAGRKSVRKTKKAIAFPAHHKKKSKATKAAKKARRAILAAWTEQPARRGTANPKKRRRNQESDSIEGAAAQFEKFHGKPPGRILEFTEALRYPEHHAELGRLIELRCLIDDDEIQLRNFGSALVVATPDGSNIYFIGGDQSLDLAALDISSDKDFVELGPCVYISYLTVKGFHDFEPTTYWHQFGEEDDIFPSLVYDRLNKRLFLTSGNYRIRPEGIVN